MIVNIKGNKIIDIKTLVMKYKRLEHPVFSGFMFHRPFTIEFGTFGTLKAKFLVNPSLEKYFERDESYNINRWQIVLHECTFWLRTCKFEV